MTNKDDNLSDESTIAPPQSLVNSRLSEEELGSIGTDQTIASADALDTEAQETPLAPLDSFERKLMGMFDGEDDEDLDDDFDSFEQKLFGAIEKLEESPTDRLGAVLAESYRLTDVIGEGGMGAVYLARHVRTGGQLAVKLVREQHKANATSALRFELEARHTAALDHPNIVRVFDYGQDDDVLYLVMEHVPGRSLQDVLDEQGAMPWERVAPILEQLLMALGAAHASEQGLIHRDIKPGNILLTDYMGQPDFVKVVDFGISRALSGEVAGTVGLIGSPHTMAPEQLESGKVTPATDMYAVGCTAYNMLNGDTPFSGNMAQLVLAHLTEEAAPLSEVAGVSEDLSAWVAWLMQKDPAARPQSALEALEGLRGVEGGGPAVPLMKPAAATSAHSNATRAVQGLPEIPIGAFVLERFIDRGATAQVWRGRHVHHDDLPVAIKILNGHEGVTGSLQREMQAIARLGHRNIVTLLDTGVTSPEIEALSQRRIPAGSPYLVMEYAPAGSLHEATRRGAWRWAEVAQVLKGLLDGLSHAHARGVLHLDVKPHNALMWSAKPDEGGVKLSDFGLARVELSEDPSERDAPVAGTPRYMAPEQLMGDQRDFGPWTDLYALGVLAWELVCGEPPYPGPSPADFIVQHLRGQLPEPAFTMEVPDGLTGWLKRLLSREPAQRFPFARDARRALEALEGRESSAEAVLEGPWPAPGSREGRPAITGLELYPLRQRPVIGREHHRDRLWEALRQVHADQQTRAVVLEGPLGYGKSRLAQWLGELAHEEALALTLTARHESSGTDTALTRMLTRHFRCAELGPEALVERLKRLWEAHGHADDYAWQALATLIHDGPLDVEGVRVIQLGKDAERFHLMERLLSLIARRRPLIVWLDDAPWSAESLAFVRHCVRNRRTPTLFVLTAGSEDLQKRAASQEALEALVGLDGVEQVRVGPFPTAESEALVRNLLDLSPELVRELVLQMRGNPLFAVRLVEDWIERDVLRANERGELMLSPDVSAELPDDLHQLWGQEVERLLEAHPGALPVLEMAAALGQEFSEEELTRACAGAGLDLSEEILVLLQRRDLLSLTGVGRWAFSHAMFRDSLARISREGGRWGALHLACARMLQADAPPPGSARVERLAYHLMEAGRHEEALEPLQATLQTSLRDGAFQRAERLLRAQEEALERLDADVDDPRTIQCKLGWARLFRLNWKFSDAEQKLREIVPYTMLEPDRQHARAMEALGHIERQRRSLRRARTFNRHALQLFERLEDEAGQADVLLADAIAARMQPDFATARALYMRSLELYRALGNNLGEALCLSGLGNMHRSQKQLGLARGRYQEALVAFQALGSLHEIANCHNGLGEVARYEKRYEDAAHHYGEALRLLREVGSRSDIAILINLALLNLHRAWFSAARDNLDQCLELALDRNQAVFLGYIYAFMLPCLAHEQDDARWDEALADARRCLTSSKIVDLDVAQEIERAGRLWQAHQRPERAREVWELALAQWESLNPERAEELRTHFD